MVALLLCGGLVQGTAHAVAPFVIGDEGFDFSDGLYYEAAFRSPSGITYNPHTNSLLISDMLNHRIRQMSLETFEVTTLAGTSSQVDRYDFPVGGHVDGDAEEAMFNRPRGMAVAPNGVIFVADAGNNAIRLIHGDKVYTVAGNGQSGHKDDEGIKAAFHQPTDIVIDSQGNLLVSDTLNHVIRRIDQEGNVTTYAGEPGKPGILFEPRGLAIDGQNQLYVADSGSQQIKVVDAAGNVSVLAGRPGQKDADTGYWMGAYANGRAEDARFNFPQGIALGPDGFLFVADSRNHSVRGISPQGRVYTLAGTGASGKDWDEGFITAFDGPSGLTFASGYYFVADYWNNRIVAIPALSEYLRPLVGISPSAEAIPVYVDGAEVFFPDVKPFIPEDHRVRVPLRFIAEELGADVAWEGDHRTVTVKMGDRRVTLSEEEGDLSLLEGRSMVTLRTLAEKLGLSIEWREDGRAVVIQSFIH